jgi:hypothetical protein
VLKARPALHGACAQTYLDAGLMQAGPIIAGLADEWKQGLALSGVGHQLHG